MNTLVVDNPYTLQTAASLALAGASDVDLVLDRAQAAAREAHHGSTLAQRRELCERAVAAMVARAPGIAEDITHMMGKPLAQAIGEVSGMAGRARHMIGIAESSLADIELPAVANLRRRIIKEPLGVVFCLPAWNYPLLTAVNVVVPAVLAGNSVVLKHSPRSPLCGEHFARAFLEAGAPPFLVQALHVDHPTSERIVGDPRVGYVAFTGSVYGGHRIQQAAVSSFVGVGLELGGNDPAYVADDCDFERSVENLVDGAMYNAGQSCCAVERVYVQRSLYPRFVERARELVSAYVLGDPMSERTTMGPIAQPTHVAELEAAVQDAVAAGAQLLCGGQGCRDERGLGRFFAPALLAEVPPHCTLLQHEHFGPLLPLCPVDSEEEALRYMNDARLGLTASVWTSDVERAERMSRRLEFGTVYMNRCDSLDPALPWTGVKDSGRGVSLSTLGFDHLTRPKAIHFREKW